MSEVSQSSFGGGVCALCYV